MGFEFFQYYLFIVFLNLCRPNNYILLNWMKKYWKKKNISVQLKTEHKEGKIQTLHLVV